MQLDISRAERLALLGALEAYRRIKGAEGKLASQRELQRDRANAKKIEASYGQLATVITGLQTKLSAS